MGVVTGLAPHALHHVGLLAGTALVAGATGSVLFGVLGLAAMVPTLVRLRRKFGTWWAPGLAVTAFAVMFTISTVVIGPAMRPDGSGRPAPAPTSAVDEHTRRQGG
jgi:hypothetical protein